MDNFIKVPNKVKTDRELSWFTKILYGEILSLTAKTWFCNASLEYFISTFWVGRDAIYRSIKSLKSKGFLSWELWNLEVKKSLSQKCDTCSENATVCSENATICSENATDLSQKRYKNENTLIYIIDNIIDKLIERKVLKERPSEKLIQAFRDFYEYRQQAGAKDKKMIPTEKSMEMIIKSMCSEKYEGIAIRKIERAIENWRRGVNYDLDDNERRAIIEKEKAKQVQQNLYHPTLTQWLKKADPNVR